MLILKNLSPGNITRSRTAIALFAAALLVGGSVPEISAKSHYGQYHPPYAIRPFPGAWHDANARIPPSSGTGRIFSGIASFYGNESGRKTASGQRFDENALTAAHRTLPFGTRLKVTRGGRSVVVTINDRGPFIRNRVLDLSTAAARAVGLTNAGVGRVVVEVM